MSMLLYETAKMPLCTIRHDERIARGRLIHDVEGRVSQYPIGGDVLRLAEYLLCSPETPRLVGRMERARIVKHPLVSFDKLMGRIEPPVANHFVRFGRGKAIYLAVLYDPSHVGYTSEEGRNDFGSNFSHNRDMRDFPFAALEYAFAVGLDGLPTKSQRDGPDSDAMPVQVGHQQFFVPRRLAMPASPVER